jgi:hypothetical protein
MSKLTYRIEKLAMKIVFSSENRRMLQISVKGLTLPIVFWVNSLSHTETLGAGFLFRIGLKVNA